MKKIVPFPIAPRGLATSFPETSMPTNFASKFRNRFINGAGGAEKRRGIQQYNTTIGGTPTLTNLHEMVKKDGTKQLFASGQGKIWREATASTWSEVFAFTNTSAKIRSETLDEYFIFYNGNDRPQFTKDGAEFEELRAVVHAGKLGGGFSQTKVEDTDVSSWTRQTDVAEKDIVFNRTVSAFAIITAITSASLTHTMISTSANGIGASVSSPASEDVFEIISTHTLDIIPTDGSDNDNVALAGVGTSAAVVAVSGVNFGTTEIKPWDFVYNSTKNALTRVVSAGTVLEVVPVSGMSANDSVEFFKSAMPIPSYVKTHFGRLYAVDARNKKKIRISGPENPKDMITDTGEINTASINFDRGTIQALETFQSFFAIAGTKSSFMYSGQDPIADTSSQQVTFNPVGSFPIGSVSPDGVANIGNDVVLVTHDGPQAIAMGNDSSSLGRTNISEQISKTLRVLIKNTNPSQIQAFHYGRRSWLMVKVGSEIYVYNYAPFFTQPNSYEARFGGDKNPGSWSLFDGKFARMNAYLELDNGDLLCCGDEGKVYIFDEPGVFDDDGEVFRTEYQTAWLLGQKSIQRKAGKYITPIIESGSIIEYTIRAEAGYDATARDEIMIDVSGGNSLAIGTAIIGENVIGGAAARAQKYALRWRGEAVRISFQTEDADGPDVIGTFFLHMVL